MCSIAFRCSRRGPNVTSNDTRNSMMETKVPNFVSTMSRTIKCNHCSKLFVNQQGLFYTVKLKNIQLSLYCIYRCFNTQNYIYPFQNLSLGFILKIFLKFREFQPRYSYKIYSYKKKRVYMPPFYSPSYQSTYHVSSDLLFVMPQFKSNNQFSSNSLQSD